MMIPEEVFKRRRHHNNTSEAIKLMIANFIVVCLAETLFSSNHHLNWFFWVIIGITAVYNFFTIRKNREVFTKVDVIAYTSSLVVLAIMVILLK